MTLSAIVIIAALKASDYLYFSFVGLACLIWFGALVLYVDKVYRAKKWKRRRERRAGYLPIYNDQADPRELLG